MASTRCSTHGKELKFFCEQRELTLCEDCLNGPPYYGSAMKVLSIDEAYRYRLAAVYNALNTQLFSKKEQLQAQLHRVDFRLEELKRHKLAIERDMKSEFAAMNERLNSACGAKQAILQHDIAELTADSERIANLVSTVEGGAQDMVGFLLKVPALKDTLEVALAKPFRTDIDVTPNDLPRELLGVQLAISEYPALQTLVNFKDELIWRQLNDKNVVNSTDTRTQAELVEWARLTDSFAKELKSLELFCEYCGALLDSVSVNADCSKNTGFSLTSGLRDVSAPVEIQGTGRHYFTANKPALQQRARQTPPEKERDPLMRQLGDIVRERKLTSLNVFKQYDVLDSEVLTPTDFFYVLTHHFALTATQVGQLAARYDSKRTGQVEYKALLRDIVAEIPLEKLRANAKRLMEGWQSQESIELKRFKADLLANNFTEAEAERVLGVTPVDGTGRALQRELLQTSVALLSRPN